MLSIILNDIGVVVAILEKESLTPIFLSNPFKQLVGSTTEDILKFLKSKDSQLTKEMLLDQDNHLKSQFVIEIIKKRARKTIDFQISHDSLGNILIYGDDITNAKKLEFLLKTYSKILEKQQKIYKIAYTDSLTDAPNRQSLFKHFSESLSKKTDTTSSVCILDIDHFKRVNDTHGHEFGDDVLKHFFKQVSDELDDQCFFARIGGEEFCIFSKNRTSQQLTELIERILDTIRNQAITAPNDEIIRISFSAGIAEYKKDGITLDELLSKADKALYFAKAIGRSCVISFSCELSEKENSSPLLRLIPR